MAKLYVVRHDDGSKKVPVNWKRMTKRLILLVVIEHLALYYFNYLHL